jgi:hypothetical protein
MVVATKKDPGRTAGVFLHQLPASLAFLAALAALLAALTGLLLLLARLLLRILAALLTTALTGLLLLLAGLLFIRICHENSYGIPLVLRDNVLSQSQVPRPTI